MRAFRRFKADQKGTTAMVFGLATLPLMGFVGAAVDYGRAAAEQSKLQRAADATAIALTREARSLTDGQLTVRGRQVFASVYSPGEGASVQDVTIERQGQVIVVGRKGEITNAFMQLVGLRATPIGTESRASSANERIELALVLDNTGSMAETIGGSRKIDELKNAATDLLAKLKEIATDRDAVRISVVPFDTEVRVQASTYRNRDWIRWSNPNSQSERNSWTGYMIDRFQPYDVKDSAPAMAVADTLYPKLTTTSQWASIGNLAYVQPLTSLYDGSTYQAVVNTINSMQPRGNTNVGLGVAWGVATLTGSIPLDTVSSTDARKVNRFMVVLTDGTNTQKWVDGVAKTPSSSSSSDPVLRMMNDRTSQACEMAKDPRGADIEVFTIRLLDGDQSLLQSCASAPNSKIGQHYFNVQSKPDLQRAFQSILEAVSQTRITS